MYLVFSNTEEFETLNPFDVNGKPKENVVTNKFVYAALKNKYEDYFKLCTISNATIGASCGLSVIDSVINKKKGTVTKLLTVANTVLGIMVCTKAYKEHKKYKHLKDDDFSIIKVRVIDKDCSGRTIYTDVGAFNAESVADFNSFEIGTTYYIVVPNEFNGSKILVLTGVDLAQLEKDYSAIISQTRC